MPKGKVTVGVGPTRKLKNKRSKFKLGGRKSVISALELTTLTLLEKFEKPSVKRDRSNIIQVLAMRGITNPVTALAEYRAAQ
jgi:hypothetical protein